MGIVRTVTTSLTFAALLMCCGTGFAATLVADGEPQAVILTADEPSSVTELGVRELNYWIERITGTTLPVVAHGAWDGEGTVVAIGPSPFMEARGIDVSELGPEGARVVVADDYVALLGRDDPPLETLTWRGTYYAVLELVGRVFGVRVIWPGELGEVYPTLATLEVPEGSWTWETPLVVRRQLRNPFSERAFNSHQQSLADLDWQPSAEAWERLNSGTSQWLRRQRMGSPSHISFGHSFTAWWDRYGEQHPEWFAMRPDGERPSTGGHGTKFCVSNDELRQRIFEGWHELWQEDPQANNVLRACPNDSRGFCTCEDCRAWDGPGQDRFTPAEIHNSPEAVLSDRYARFWSDLAERVTAVDPEAVITGYAYRSYQHPPLEASVHPSVILGYVGGEGFFPHEDHIRPEWQAWAEAGATMFWRPNLLLCGHGAPYIFARALGEEFKYLHGHNMVGTDFDSLQSAWATQAPNYYVLAELHSRPDADVEELLREFFTAFGPGADAVAEYFDYWERVTEDGPDLIMELAGGNHRRTWGQWFPGFIELVPYLYTDEVLDAGEEILHRAEAAAAAGDEREVARVAFLRTGFDHTRLMATALREMYLLQKRDPATDEARWRAATEALLSFRQQHEGSFAFPAAGMTTRELRYRQTRPLWIRGE